MFDHFDMNMYLIYHFPRDSSHIFFLFVPKKLSQLHLNSKFSNKKLKT